MNQRVVALGQKVCDFEMSAILGSLDLHFSDCPLHALCPLEIQCWERNKSNPVIMNFENVQRLGSGGLNGRRLIDVDDNNLFNRKLSTSTFEFNCILSENNVSAKCTALITLLLLLRLIVCHVHCRNIITEK